MKVPLYRLEQVRKRHSDSFTLEVERLDVDRGESLCLVGPTGAGKSTLLRLLSGLDAPSAGKIMFDGVPDATGLWPLAALRRIATVSQQPILLSDTVLYNVEFGLRVRGECNRSDRSKALLERRRIGNLADQDARTLSGGQLQLVALARALIVQPQVLLLDEPTANLDPANVAVVEELVEDQRQRTRMSIVWATHNLFQARRMGTRTALLLNGKLIEVAETSQFFERPSDPRTAQFVQGKMVY